MLTRPVARALLSLLLALLAACAAPHTTPHAPPPPLAPPQPIPLDLSHAVVIGASVSDGFGATIPGRPQPGPLPMGVKLARTLAAIAPASGPLPTFTSSFFFMNSERTAELQINNAVDENPALVFAVDYLFWHAYGEMPDADRPARLTKGLERLSRLSCPVVIADLPDMSHSIGIMLTARQVPAPDTLAALNLQLKAWAHARPNVVVLPLADLVAKAMHNQPVHIGGRLYPPPASRDLLCSDGLHASLPGQIAVALEALARLHAAGALPPHSDWDRDPDSILNRLSAPAPAPDELAPAAPARAH